jgi:hypothetical protein
MPSMKSKLRLMCSFAALATLALAVSCTGFFVKPTLTSLAVGPAAPTIDTGTTDNTVQMFAVGTFNDGSTGSTAVTWSISPSDNSVATISGGGLVTSVNTGTATVTATATQNPAVTGTQTVTVNIANVTSIVITPTTGNVSANGGFTTFQAFANVSGSSIQVDVSAQATWSIAPNSANFTLTQGSTPETVTTTTTAMVGELDTLTATYTSGTTVLTATAKVTVTQ